MNTNQFGSTNFTEIIPTAPPYDIEQNSGYPSNYVFEYSIHKPQNNLDSLTTPLNDTPKKSNWSFNWFSPKQDRHSQPIQPIQPIAQEMHPPVEGMVYFGPNVEAELVNEPSHCAQECNRFTKTISNYLSACLKCFNNIIECPALACNYLYKLYLNFKNNPGQYCFLFTFLVLGPSITILFFALGGYYIQDAKNHGARIRTYYYPCSDDHSKTCHHSECYDASAKICGEYDTGEGLVITASVMTIFYIIMACAILKNGR